MLRRLTRRGHAPRLGVAAWLTAIGSVLISWVAVAVVFVVDIVGHWSHRVRSLGAGKTATSPASSVKGAVGSISGLNRMLLPHKVPCRRLARAA